MILEGKTILITGGTGSMGKTLVRRILSDELGRPKKVIVFSRDEGKQHNMRVEYLHRKNCTDDILYNNFKNILEFRIGNIRSYSDVSSVLKKVDIVINAAALKQVPSCEYFPSQAVLTNIIGAENIVRAIEEFNLPVEKVVGISTDKAAKPVNVMGMTKAIMERIFTSANILNKDTSFMCVRYGNVLSSRGSVIPLFLEQIENGGPITITEPEMTRFLISLNDAVDTVFAALRDGKPGEIFVPRARSSSVLNIAKALIGNKKVHIELIGRRPGEKMHEVLISKEEIDYCEVRGDWFVIRSMLPELNNKVENTTELIAEFNSENCVLSLAGTNDLLKKNSLNGESLYKDSSYELLR